MCVAMYLVVMMWLQSLFDLFYRKQVQVMFMEMFC